MLFHPSLPICFALYFFTQLRDVREDHLRRLNPTPYKVSVTSDLYTFMHDLWLAEAPVPEFS